MSSRLSARWSLRRCPICLIPSCQAQAQPLTNTREMLGYLYTNIWRVSAPLVSPPSAAPASHQAEAEVNIRIFPLSVGGTRARCREMSDEWETKGK